MHKYQLICRNKNCPGYDDGISWEVNGVFENGSILPEESEDEYCSDCGEIGESL